MTQSLLRWHLARDNQLKLAKFCDKHQVGRDISDYSEVDGQNCFNMYTRFDNGGWVVAELIQGISIADHYQVINYNLGN